MTDTPILDIPIDDSAFQKFLEDFEKHKAGLSKLPGVWGTIGKSINSAGSSMDHLAIASVTMGAALDKMAASQERFLNLTRSSTTTMEGLSRHTGNVAKNLADGAVSLLKWSTVISSIGGLIGAGGLAFGFDKLAGYGAAGRRAGMALGTTSAGVRAFSDVYGGTALSNPTGLISGVADAQNDITKQLPLMLLGLTQQDIQGADTTTLAAKALDAVRKRARAASENQLGGLAERSGWASLGISLEDVRAMRNMSDQEWAEKQGKYGAARAGMTTAPAAEKAFSDLIVQLNTAKDTIGSVLVTGLGRVAPSLEHLSESVVNVFRAFADNPNLPHWIDEVSSAMERLARKIGDWLGVAPNSPSGALQGPTRSGLTLDDPAIQTPIPGSMLSGRPVLIAPSGHLIDRLLGVPAGSRQSYIYDTLVQNGATPTAAAGFLGNFKQESGFDPMARRIDPRTGRPAGDQGIAQWTASRKAQFRKMFGHDPADAAPGMAMQEQTTFMIWELQHQYKGAANAANAAQTPEEAAWAALRYYEAGNPKDWDTNPQWELERARRGMFAKQIAQPGATQFLLGQRNLSPAPVTVHVQINQNTSAVTSTAAGTASGR